MAGPSLPFCKSLSRYSGIGFSHRNIAVTLIQCLFSFHGPCLSVPRLESEESCLRKQLTTLWCEVLREPVQRRWAQRPPHYQTR